MTMPYGWRKPEDCYEMEKREVSALLWAARNLERDPRSYYLLALCYLLGLRLGEAVRLEWRHVGPTDAAGRLLSVRIPTLKQRQGATPLISVPVLSHPKLVAAAMNPARRKAERTGRSPWVFPGVNPAFHLSTRQGTRLFTYARDAAGLKKGYTSHSLRHTAVVEIGKFETEKLGLGQPSHVTAAAFLRHRIPGATAAYMRITMTQWERYRGCLDLPPLAPLRPPNPAPPRV